jgi:hypothetical protein
MVSDTIFGVDATGGAGGVATGGVGEVGDEPQATDNARITTLNEILLIINFYPSLSLARVGEPTR